jgi:ketosteroid isomerase-like protein
MTHSHDGEADALQVVRVKFDAFNRHDVAALQHIYADDAVLQSPEYPHLAGNSQIADSYRRLFEAIPDARDEVRDMRGSGDRVFVEFTVIGHFNDAAQTPISGRIASIYTIKGGRIIDDSTYYDRKAR